MQITVNEETTRERPDRAELFITIGGKARAVIVIALDPAGRDSQGLAGSVREQLCDLVERMDDWIRRGQRLIVSRDDVKEEERPHLFAGYDWLQGC